MTQRPLRPFQQRIHQYLLQGKNVIVQTPTGSGKTWGALAAYFQNLAHRGQALPRSCIYATPLRILATQFHERYADHIRRIDRLRGTDFGRTYERLERRMVSIQTGEQPDDPALEALLTFGTIDQLLASFLAIPYSLGGRFGNLNVGAVLSSYLVFDEFHLFPLTGDGERCFGARTTVLALLQLLNGITPFVIMTATFSSTLLEQLKQLLNAEVVTITEEHELQELAGDRSRRFELAETAMQSKSILGRHDGCSLVVCNTVARAQALYWRLKPAAEAQGIEMILLHSRLTAIDREVRSATIMRQLGPAPNQWDSEERYGWKQGVYYGKNMIVVSTQVIEVGLDISVRTLHTEIAPANSLIQRAGRCARFSKQSGTVIVYDLPRDDKTGKAASAKPYDDALCASTHAALGDLLHQRQNGNDHIGFLEEQQLIDAVHTEEDRILLARFQHQQGYIRKRIMESLQTQQRSVVSELIRDVAQVQILIHDHPQDGDGTSNRGCDWTWQSFGMHPLSLAFHMKSLRLRAAKLGLSWVCKEMVAAKEEGGAQENVNNETDSRQPTRFTWIDLDVTGEPHQLAKRLQATLLIALPSQLATYHPDLGFLLLDETVALSSTGYQSTPTTPRSRRRGGSYEIQEQSYQTHIQGLVNAYNNGIRQSMQYPARRMEILLDLPAGCVDQAFRLAIACHDLGKLGEGWQQWALEWQHLLYAHQPGWPTYQRRSTAYFFAKTDYDGSLQQRQLQRSMPLKRPHHACESVAIGANLIAESLRATARAESADLLLYATLGAIARHHAPLAHTYGPVHLQAGAENAVQEALEIARQGLPWNYHLNLLNTSIAEGDDLAPATDGAVITLARPGRRNELETWLYFLLVRALRLADQRADRFRDTAF